MSMMMLLDGLILEVELCMELCAASHLHPEHDKHVAPSPGRTVKLCMDVLNSTVLHRLQQAF